mmetsp:Transcript_29275/g.67922  ORF Transcript_29275/g.67922 Transcript_29275/m.67922 type:complete len:101 (-) Transcript_29275:8-310(-)
MLRQRRTLVALGLATIETLFWMKSAGVPGISLEDKLSALRRGAPPGSVQDVHRKHLLALAARKAATSTLVPRSYLLAPDPSASEWEDFKLLAWFEVRRLA